MITLFSSELMKLFQFLSFRSELASIQVQTVQISTNFDGNYQILIGVFLNQNVGSFSRFQPSKKLQKFPPKNKKQPRTYVVSKIQTEKKIATIIRKVSLFLLRFWTSLDAQKLIFRRFKYCFGLLITEHWHSDLHRIF